MSMPTQSWNTIHPSVFRQAFEPVRRVAATLRPRGAVRYSCPLTHSFVLITEAATIAGLIDGDARLRCADCGEMHLLTLSVPTDAAAIVATPAKP
ncbi:MAG TPA: hypothetical protein VIJ78_03010 [Pseudolabrys sp.]